MGASPGRLCSRFHLVGMRRWCLVAAQPDGVCRGASAWLRQHRVDAQGACLPGGVGRARRSRWGSCRRRALIPFSADMPPGPPRARGALTVAGGAVFASGACKPGAVGRTPLTRPQSGSLPRLLAVYGRLRMTDCTPPNAFSTILFCPLAVNLMKNGHLLRNSEARRPLKPLQILHENAEQVKREPACLKRSRLCLPTSEFRSKWPKTAVLATKQELTRLLGRPASYVRLSRRVRAQVHACMPDTSWSGSGARSGSRYRP